MLTQEEQYTELLEPIPEPHQVPHNDNDVISEVTRVEQDFSDPKTIIDMTPKLMAKAFHLNNTTSTNNNQRSSSNPCNTQIAQPSVNTSQDIQMLMVDDNVRNQFRKNIGQIVRNQSRQNAVQNVIKINRLSVILRITNQYGNRKVVSTWAVGNDNGINGSYEEIERVNSNCTLKDNLQRTSTSGTQTDSAPVYDSDGSAENDINVIYELYSMQQSRGTVEQPPVTIEETLVYLESLHNNLAIEVEKVNLVNSKMNETNADLTTELARYKNQEKCFEINQEKYDKLESGSELEDDDYNVYDYASSAESDTALIDHLSKVKEEVLDVRTKKVGLKPKNKAIRMFGEKFLTSIFNRLPRDDFDDGNDPKTDYYGILWSYAAEILASNKGSTCKIGIDRMPNGQTHFSNFYIRFKALKVGWLEGCTRVIGLDGCFLKTIGKGDLLLVVGRDGIIEVVKAVIPLAEHRQRARHIYANFIKKFTGV
nr:hypothetical protein [Tanacetum cinerariifolium]